MLNESLDGVFAKPRLSDIFSLREWMPFSDQEISIFQNYFMDYFSENESSLSKKAVYKLACLANETQYQIRLLKARISGDKNVNEKSNNHFIYNLMSFDGLVSFVKNKMIADYEKTSIENKAKLINQPYSYFSASDAVKDSIKQDFDLYFSSKFKPSKKHFAIFKRITEYGYYLPASSDKEPATVNLEKQGIVKWRDDYRGVIFTEYGKELIKSNKWQ